MTPENWIERFTDALATLCGEEPPSAFVAGWLAPDGDGWELQSWAAERTSLPWAQGIVTLDAAVALADSPEEGTDAEDRPIHADRVTPNAELSGPQRPARKDEDGTE